MKALYREGDSGEPLEQRAISGASFCWSETKIYISLLIT